MSKHILLPFIAYSYYDRFCVSQYETCYVLLIQCKIAEFSFYVQKGVYWPDNYRKEFSKIDVEGHISMLDRKLIIECYKLKKVIKHFLDLFNSWLPTA